VTEIGKSAEGLHEALRGAVFENGLDGFLFADFFPEGEELGAFLRGVLHVWIVEQGGEVVFLAAHAEALEVDEIGLAVVEHEVLGLEVTVNHVRSGGAEALGEAEENGVFTKRGRVFFEVSLDKVLEEILLLPAVERFVKDGLKIEVFWRAGVEEFIELLEGGTVVWLAGLEWFAFQAEEVLVSEILNEGDLAAGVIVKDARDIQSGAGEEFGDGKEVGIVRAFEGVVNADEAGVIIWLNADDGATRGSLSAKDRGGRGRR